MTLDGEGIVLLILGQIEAEYKQTMRALQSNAKPDSLIRMRSLVELLEQIPRLRIDTLDSPELRRLVVHHLQILIWYTSPSGTVYPTGKDDLVRLIQMLGKEQKDWVEFCHAERYKYEQGVMSDMDSARG